ncbi:MAG: hypothetical protein SO135_04780 [Sphaerochaetaceae bacterium]|nr:hypothetical protein [Sphaerochaetaceae bacterium]
MYLGFSWTGFVVFLLPMIINVPFCAILDNQGKNNKAEKKTSSGLESLEKASRSLYAISLCILISGKQIDYLSPLMFVAALFLILYTATWIRYYRNGCDRKLLKESFLCVPMPLVIFPLVYFVLASIWMNNLISLAFLIPFAIAHGIVSYHNLIEKEKSKKGS